jgi:hypothetical protein
MSRPFEDRNDRVAPPQQDRWDAFVHVVDVAFNQLLVHHQNAPNATAARAQVVAHMQQVLELASEGYGNMRENRPPGAEGPRVMYSENWPGGT